MYTRPRVGIIFGGPSREREISFAGGRTVYDNLDKRLFEPIPLFMTASRRLILLEWSYIYKGTIRDFWPPVMHYPTGSGSFQLSEESLGELSEERFQTIASHIGTPVTYDSLNQLIDVAFLALHGVGGEDGAIQGMLESLNIPYTGSGLPGSAIGMDKVLQKRLMSAAGFNTPPSLVIDRKDWNADNATFVKTLYDRAVAELGTPLVVRGANQGSSIGVSILREPTVEALADAIDVAFFRHTVDMQLYRMLDTQGRRSVVSTISDLRHGIGFPLQADDEYLTRPDELFELLESTPADEIKLVGDHSESRAVIEGFLAGTEVSTIVLRTDDGGSLALLPTQIVKGGEVFDYRSKYLPGRSRKKTPADIPSAQLEAVRKEAERLFDYFEFDTYARIDGFVSEDGEVTLNDPNTTSGMLPSSFFFHQAAEIGLAPSEFLTFILRTSLRERSRRATSPNEFLRLANAIDKRLKQLQSSDDDRIKIAVLLGGYSSERHISVESGRNIFEKLASSGKYAPVPVFVAGDSESHRMYELPINMLLKDNADDILAAILANRNTVHPSTRAVRDLAAPITELFSARANQYSATEISYEQIAERFDEVFIALHGRPGEDGEVQRELERVNIPYNGSGYDSSQLTIDKYATLGKLRDAGFVVTQQQLVTAEAYREDPAAIISQLSKTMGFPLIVKPVDDGCSSAVQKIDTADQLHDFLTLLLNLQPDSNLDLRRKLSIDIKDEIPQKSVALVEQMIARQDADLFMEITGGLLTSFGESGKIKYQVFEPSEALSIGKVLSLEEKFLAGEGQNITPARFATGKLDYETIASQVRDTLGRAAKILGVEGYARIDAFVRAWHDGKVETIIIEVNSLPGMTPATCIYHQAALEQLTPFGFIDAILHFGRERLARNTVAAL